LRKLRGGHNRISLVDLPLSRIDKIQRFALVGNIRDEVYQSLNSKNYPPEEGLYPVVKLTSGRVHIHADKRKKPVIPYGYPKKIDGVLEVLSAIPDGSAEIALNVSDCGNRSYCRICGSYVIVASLRQPQAHLGARRIICAEGTRVFVYAFNNGTKDSVSHLGGTSRVYAFGVFPSEITPKLDAETVKIYKAVYGVMCSNIPANSEFTPLAPCEAAGGNGVTVEL
jgi:hypothetical protein